MQVSVQLSQGSSSGKENNALEGILICHVDGIVYGGTDKFESKIISKLKQTFKFDTEDAKVSVKYILVKSRQVNQAMNWMKRRGSIFEELLVDSNGL